MLKAYVKLQPSEWSQVETEITIKRLGVRLPEQYRSGLVSYQRFNTFLNRWSEGEFDPEPPKVNGVESAPQALGVTPSNQIVTQSLPTSGELVNQFGDGSLYPEQFEAFKDAIAKYTKYGGKGLVNNGATGSGKTFLACALIYHYGVRTKLQERDLLSRFRLCPFVVFTRRSLIPQWREDAISMGLGPLLKSGKLQILSYAELWSSNGSKWITKEYDAWVDDWIYKWNPSSVPLFVVFDEAHALYNLDSIQAKSADALWTAAKRLQCMSLVMSATLADTVAKAGGFISSIRCPVQLPSEDGFTTVTVRSANDWQKEYAYAITPEPTKSNSAAMRRVRDMIEPYLVEIANVKWPARARNRPIVVDFPSPTHRERYDRAYTIYLEKLEKLGRAESTNPLQQWIAYAEFAKVGEPMRNRAIAQRIRTNLSHQIASVVIHNYKQSISDLIFELESLGIHRKDISLVWGGGKDYKEGYIFTEAQLNEYTQMILSGKGVSKSTLKRMEDTIRFRQELIASGDTEEERFKHYSRLRALGMTGSQSPDLRWQEVKRFKTGITKVCIATSATGGVGLSLDRSRPELWVRELFTGISINGPEFKQKLGRLVRRGTLPGYVDQYIISMRNSVEDQVFMPYVERKLGNMKELAATGIDPTEILLNAKGRMDIKHLTLDELTRIADSDESQIIATDSDDEEGDDE